MNDLFFWSPMGFIQCWKMNIICGNGHISTCASIQNIFTTIYLFLVSSPHREETTHWCKIWVKNIGSSLNQCVSDILNSICAFDRLTCSIKVHAYRCRWKLSILVKYEILNFELWTCHKRQNHNMISFTLQLWMHM
jgi:Na+-transporting NADH:ubiquinone oxidoreductase subunit NqrF